MNSNNNYIIPEILIQLFNALFKKYQITSMKDLLNEKLLKKLILEIEPNLQNIPSNNKIDITEDNSFGIKYANFDIIINCIDRYKNNSPEKERYTSNFNFKKLIDINDLLNSEKENLILLFEMIFFLTYISSKKDNFLDKLNDLEDVRLINCFFNIIEKYIILKGEDTINQSNLSKLEKSYIFSNQINKIKEDYEKEIKSLINIIKDNENKILILRNKNENLEKILNETENKLKDKEREFEMLKKSQTQNLKYQEQLFKDNLANSDLINKLSEKEYEINEIKNEFEKLKKSNNEIISNLTDKNEILENKIKEYENFQLKYEKLKNKYNNLNNNNNNNENQSDLILKENQILHNQIEKLMSELYKKNNLNLKKKIKN